MVFQHTYTIFEFEILVTLYFLKCILMSLTNDDESTRTPVNKTNKCVYVCTSIENKWKKNKTKTKQITLWIETPI